MASSKFSHFPRKLERVFSFPLSVEFILFLRVYFLSTSEKNTLSFSFAARKKGCSIRIQTMKNANRIMRSVCAMAMIYNDMKNKMKTLTHIEPSSKKKIYFCTHKITSIHRFPRNSDAIRHLRQASLNVEIIDLFSLSLPPNPPPDCDDDKPWIKSGERNSKWPQSTQCKLNFFPQILSIFSLPLALCWCNILFKDFVTLFFTLSTTVDPSATHISSLQSQQSC